MQKNRFLGAFFSVLCFVVSLTRLPAHEPAEWPADCKVGILLRYFPTEESGTNRLRKEFQVERIADQAASAGADYLVLTMNGDSGWFNAPNAVYDRVTGYETDDRCAARDIPMEMADALARRGIKFFIGVTARVPARDALAPGPEGTAPFSFPLYVQPILDRRCVSCHGGEEGNVKPDLRGVVEKGAFSVAYDNLTEYARWYQWGKDTIAPITSRPGEGGADMSRLTEILDDADHGEKIGLTDEDRRAFYLWLDANVPFYGTAEPETRAAELEGKPVPMPPVQ